MVHQVMLWCPKLWSIFHPSYFLLTGLHDLLIYSLKNKTTQNIIEFQSSKRWQFSSKPWVEFPVLYSWKIMVCVKCYHFLQVIYIGLECNPFSWPRILQFCLKINLYKILSNFLVISMWCTSHTSANLYL